MRPRDATHITWKPGVVGGVEVLYLHLHREEAPRGYISHKEPLWDCYKFNTAGEPEWVDAGHKLALAKLRLANACEAVKEQ